MSLTCGGALPGAGGGTTADTRRTQGSSAQVSTPNVHRLGEGSAQEDGGLSPEGEMLKGPEKEASSHGACLSSRLEDEVFHYLLQQLRFWSFLLSSVSWQSLFSVFLEIGAHSSGTYGREVLKPSC